MRILFIALWCILPLGLVAFHYGPGREHLALDESGAALDRARAHLAVEAWEEAIPELEAALSTLPDGHQAEARRIELELLKARMMTGKLPEARGELESLIARIDPDQEPALHADALDALSNARFHMSYLMKLEGLPETEWGPEIDAARQERKLLFQRASEAGNTAAAQRHADDLESAIKLARMDPAELYGKAIPKQCQGCSSGKCNKPSQKQGKKKSPDARGASSGPPIDGEGS